MGLPFLATSGSSLRCNQTLAAIQTRSLETVQERLGIVKAQSVNALGVLVRAKARIGLKNLAYNLMMAQKQTTPVMQM